MSIELKYDSVAALVAAAEKAGEPISALVLRQQAAQLEKTEQETTFSAREAVEFGLADQVLDSLTGLPRPEAGA